MPAPVCVPCQRFFRPSHNGVTWEELRQDGGDRLAPYRLWMGDEWACPECGTRIIVGHGAVPIAEHYQEGYERQKTAEPPIVSVI